MKSVKDGFVDIVNAGATYDRNPVVVDENIIFKMNNIIPLEKIIDNNLETFLMITIWLGNAHCFKHNYNKCLKSYFYGLYLATLFFNKYDI